MVDSLLSPPEAAKQSHWAGKATSSARWAPSPRKKERGEGTALRLPQVSERSGNFDAVPSPALLLEKVPKGRMRSLTGRHGQ